MIAGAGGVGLTAYDIMEEYPPSLALGLYNENDVLGLFTFDEAHALSIEMWVVMFLALGVVALMLIGVYFIGAEAESRAADGYGNI